MSRAIRQVSGSLALLRVVALLWHYRLRLWLLPFDRVTHLAQQRMGLGEVNKPEQLYVQQLHVQQRLARRIERAAWFVPHATCLVRVLAGAQLFAARGQRADVVIGVRRRAGLLEAHAWLESGGQVVLGDVQDLTSYHPLRR